MLASNVASSSNNSQQQATPTISDGGKLSPPTTLSPENSNSKNKVMSDEPNGNNNHSSCSAGKGATNNVSAGLSSTNDGSGGTSVTNNTSTASSATNVHRQNSNSSSINTCVASVNTCSPNNGSDHSNSSNISSNLTQMIDGTAADMLHDEKMKKSIQKEEDNVKPQLTDKGDLSSNDSKVSGVKSMPTMKEDSDLINSLVNIKKEDNLSPNMSPVGFGSIGTAGNTADISGRAITPVKMELGNHSSACNNTADKVSATLGLTVDDGTPGNHLGGGNSMNENSVTGISGGTGGNGGIGLSSNAVQPGAPNFGGGGGPAGSCMDYMQQQNHIFVFSTQLANKGAESVLSGQFQTIIAYHCTQPATKSFLEDFFIKNPMKMNKLQRQNSLNICNIPGSGGQPWMNQNTIGPGKLQQKPNGAKPNVNQNDSVNKTQILRPATNILPQNSFGEGSAGDTLTATENDLLCWEQPRIECGPSENQSVKLLEPGGVEVPVSASLNKSNESGNCDSNIPSLQGVKVPDENLTPQQRQHREEQLAKLKKMNQFLFPENDAAKLTNDNNISSIPSNMMINMPAGGGTLVQGMPNTPINPSMRQMQSNMLNHNKSDHISGNSIGEDVLLPGDMIGDIGQGMQCSNPQKAACGNNLPCGSVVMGINVGNMSGNNLQCGSNNGALMSNSPELMSSFGGPNISELHKSLPTNQDMPSVGVAQIEWSKMQHQFFEERVKVNKVTGRTNMSGPVTQSGAPSTNQTLRGSSQGPPPPYHPTQRSASVPIATQSPNPSSPNNPTSNLSLPSPRTTLGISSSSPNVVDSTSSNSTAITSTTTTTSTISIAPNIVASKNCFQSESGSPSNRSRNSGSCSTGGNGGGSGLNQFNSNPSTPLSHMSPKDLDSFNTSGGTTGNSGDLKNTRPSPQRPRTPGNTNNLIDTSNMEARFPASSPGLNFNPQIQNNSNSSMSVYKGPSSGPNLLERQNSIGSSSGTVQFCRRSDNLPLNPNSNRNPQNKLNQGFDPISSLAQMSQQLTSCVSGVGGGPASSGSGGMVSSNEINLNPNLDSMMSAMDGNSMEHLSSAGPFSGSVSGSNCHPMSSLINPIGQRMLNPKICGPSGPGFNSTVNGPAMRDNVGPNFHGVMPPSTRIMGRMPVNFGNFNVSPNIQVKASTPNTIQYMPVRSQNNNPTNNNVRMPPSLEFLQRYANPQMASGGPGGSGPLIGNDIVGGGPMNLNPANEQNKLSNNPGAMGPGSSNNPVCMNFFSQNCNQMPGMDEDGITSGMMSTHDMNLGQIRGMRPHTMRQHSMGPRMQAPPSGNQQQQVNNPFPGQTSDGIDCHDTSSIFSTNGPQSIFGLTPSQQQQQKSLKSMPPGMCQNMNAPNAPGGSNMVVHGNGPNNGPGMLSNELGSTLQQSSGNNSVMMGGNNNMLSTGVGGNSGQSGSGPNGNNGNPNNYKPFVGPSSNDLKYAQQYHSFQQQLYATSTRSQQQPGTGNINMVQNVSPNPAFFGNK